MDRLIELELPELPELPELSKDRQEHPLLVGVVSAAEDLDRQVICMPAWHVNQQVVAALDQEEVGGLAIGVIRHTCASSAEKRP